MTGVRLAREGDVGAIRQIWRASFPGDEAFCDWYLKSVFRPENALVWTQDAQPRGMLHLVPARVAAGDRVVSCAYVYAVATLPPWRGRGVAAALLEEAQALSLGRGASLLMLVPQSEGLFEYYRRQGFETAFSRGRREIALPGAPRLGAREGAAQAGREGLQLSDAPDPSELDALYEAALAGRDHVVRGREGWQRALTYLRALGVRRGGALLGYAIYDPEGGSVREVIAGDEGVRDLLEQGALSRLGLERAVAFSPDGPGTPYGMARAIEPGLSVQNAYANLMLD